MNEHPAERGVADVVKTYELLDRVRRRETLVLRDDQFEFPALLDMAVLTKQKGLGFYLVDTGRFDRLELDWLGGRGANLLTADDVRPRPEEIRHIHEGVVRGGGYTAFFLHGQIREEGKTAAFTLQDLRAMAAAGIDLHLSDREHPRDAAALRTLAESAREGGSYLVFYHHGPLTPEIAGLAGLGAWVHASDRELGGEGEAAVLLSAAAGAKKAGSSLVLHVEQGVWPELLEKLRRAGAHLLFKTPPAEEGSPLRLLEKKARRRKLPARAFYLTTAFLP